ncbi:hypothetical protein [Stutzerimonas degradans]
MVLGLKIAMTGGVVALFAVAVVTLCHKGNPPDSFKAIVVTAFALGAIAIPVGIIVAIWT